jgi:hypothetical protein
MTQQALFPTLPGLVIDRFRYVARWNAHTELRTERQRFARESGRQVECPYRVACKASALGAGNDIPKPAYCPVYASTPAVDILLA